MTQHILNLSRVTSLNDLHKQVWAGVHGAQTYQGDRDFLFHFRFDHDPSVRDPARAAVIVKTLDHPLTVERGMRIRLLWRTPAWVRTHGKQCRTPDDPLDWASQRLAAAGLAPTLLSAGPIDWLYVGRPVDRRGDARRRRPRGPGSRPRGFSAPLRLFSGSAVVTDVDKAREALSRGLGRLKGFGCGWVLDLDGVTEVAGASNAAGDRSDAEARAVSAAPGMRG